MKRSFSSLSEKSVFLKKPMVLKDWAYEQIKHWILDLEIPPGTSLVINDLANEMNISSTPVRDALHRLVAEGLIQIKPRLGFFVSEITQDDLKQLFEMRILIEGFAAEKAAPLLTNEEIETLGELFEECLPSEDEEFSKEFLIADQKFHAIILENTQNPKLNQIMDMLQDLTHQGVALGTTSFSNVQKSCNEHKQILTALRNRDGIEAGRQMRAHLTAVMDRLLGMLNTPDVWETGSRLIQDERDEGLQSEK